MSYACRTWGKAVGAFGPTQGAVNGGGIDLSDTTFDLPGEDAGFGDEHSAQFSFRIQQLQSFYTRLLQSLDVTFNHL